MGGGELGRSRLKPEGSVDFVGGGGLMQDEVIPDIKNNITQKRQFGEP